MRFKTVDNSIELDPHNEDHIFFRTGTGISTSVWVTHVHSGLVVTSPETYSMKFLDLYKNKIDVADRICSLAESLGYFVKSHNYSEVESKVIKDVNYNRRRVF